MFVTLPINAEVRNQMDVVDDFLNLIKGEGWSTIVAGGAPRDWFFNKKAKDIDIFLPPMDVQEIASILKEKYNLVCIIKMSEDIDETYRSPNLLAVIDFKYLNTDFQFIFQTQDLDPLTHFGCSLSLITYDNFNIKPTQQFLRCIKNSTLIFLESCNATYLKKNIKKFPNYSVNFLETIYQNRAQPRVFGDVW